MDPGIPDGAVEAARAAAAALRLLARACGLSSMSVTGYGFPWTIGHPHPGSDGAAHFALCDASGRSRTLDAAAAALDLRFGGVLG